MRSSLKEKEQVQSTQVSGNELIDAPDRNIEENTSIQLSPVSITKLLLFITLILLLGHLFTVHLAGEILENFKPSSKYTAYEALYWAFYKQFHLAADGNIPTYFSSILLAIASILLYLIHRTSKRKTYHWFSISIIFLFLSIDESTQLHETFGGLVGNKVNSYLKEIPAFLRWEWMIPYTILTLIVALYYFKFTWKLPSRTRNLFILSGFVYVFAALFLEFLESHFDKTIGSENLVNVFLYPIEEILEMVGIIIFIYALLEYLKYHAKHFRIEPAY